MLLGTLSHLEFSENQSLFQISLLMSFSFQKPPNTKKSLDNLDRHNFLSIKILKQIPGRAKPFQSFMNVNYQLENLSRYTWKPQQHWRSSNRSLFHHQPDNVFKPSHSTVASMRKEIKQSVATCTRRFSYFLVASCHVFNPTNSECLCL